MRKTTVKRIGIIIPLMTLTVFSLLFSACQKTFPKAHFLYNIRSGTNYATCELTNDSRDAESYEWTLIHPDGSKEKSYSYEPSFRCYQIGTYTISLVAINRYGMDSYTQYFDVYYNGGGGNGGGNGGGPQTVSAYTIKWLRLEKIPMLDENNGSWDTGLFGGGNPDIYFMIQDASNTTTYYTSAVKEDVSESDFPVTWYNVNTTLEKGKEYRIKFVDQDGVLDFDDVMANCIWEWSHLTPGATSYTWYNGSRNIKFTVGLSWIYNKSDMNEILTPGVSANEPMDGDSTPISIHQ